MKPFIFQPQTFLFYICARHLTYFNSVAHNTEKVLIIPIRSAQQRSNMAECAGGANELDTSPDELKDLYDDVEDSNYVILRIGRSTKRPSGATIKKRRGKSKNAAKFNTSKREKCQNELLELCEISRYHSRQPYQLKSPN
jgi:hypothetical protein